MASRRAIRLELHGHRLPCPYCDTPIEFFSPMPVLSLDDRICPKCGKSFLIQDGVAKRLVKKAAQKVRSNTSGGLAFPLRTFAESRPFVMMKSDHQSSRPVCPVNAGAEHIMAPSPASETIIFSV
jgi:hypothetical protein